MGLRWWRWEYISIQLYEANGGSIDDTGFDRFEVVVGTTKMNKNHNEQYLNGKGEFGYGWGFGIVETSVGGMQNLKNDVSNNYFSSRWQENKEKGFKKVEKVIVTSLRNYILNNHLEMTQKSGLRLVTLRIYHYLPW